MPSSEGEVTTAQAAEVVEQVDTTATKLETARMAQVVPEVVIGRSPARINPKRKPDKSKIFRIRTSDADELHICPYCRAELGSREQLEEHRVACGREPPVLEVPDNPRPQYHDSSYPDELRRHQDVANNNQAHILKARNTNESTSDSRESSVDRNNGYDSDSNNPAEGGALAHIRNLLAQSSNTPSVSSVGPIAQQLAQSNLTLEAIQNTRMALAQFATSAMNSPGANNPQAMQEFAVLQGTLFSLQQQQMMQLQLIQQLQAQLSIKKEDSPTTPNQSEGESKGPNETQENHDSPSPPKAPLKPPPPPTSEASQGVSSSFINSIMERFKSPPMSSDASSERPRPSSPLCAATTSGPTLDPRDRPISPPMTASSIASSVIQHTDPPPPDEPNTLEMLQRTANSVLSNASQGLLTSRLIDDHRPPDGKDPYYKHRCRYCGKVFGSDSALQIHIRSHTGERPYKCNICGNRFTTKGNLKVHFQRHTSRFPHVKMNPHPVPEHLDKFHPPLLAQLGELKDYPSPPTGPPNPFSPLGGSPSLPPYRLPGPPSLDLHRPFNLLNLVRQSREEEPENLSITDPRSPSETGEREFSLGRMDSNPMDVDESSRHSKFDGQMEGVESSDAVGSVEMADDREDRYEEQGSVPEKRYDDDEMFDDEKRDEEKSFQEENEADEKRDNVSDDKIDEDKHFESEERTVEEEDEEEEEEKSFNDEESRFEPEIQFKTESMRDESEERFIDSQEMRDLMERKSSERELNNKQTPLDIRIRTEKELKEADEGNGINNKSDQNMESSEPRPVNPDQPTDLRLRPEFRPLGMPTIPIPGPRHPLAFPFLPGIPTSFPGPMGPPSIPPGVDPAKDPSIYTNLLPKPGSNDNSWEALIEVQKTSETMKLEQLVNNIENKLTDPNQCIICHRVLSCKSALQMHYRTHTGERPFKCKICGRAFTTKGNLKTHMGVHRAKPPMRMLHQCPVCHKKYTNALVLQQHIRQHTGEPTDLTPEQIAAAEVRDFPHLHTPTSLPQMLPSGFPLPPPPLQGFPPLPLHLRYQLSPEAFRQRELMESEERNAEEDKYLRPFSTSSRSSSAGSAEQRTAEDLTMRSREDGFNGMNSPRVSVSPTPSDYSDLGDRSHDAPGDNHVSPSGHQISGSVSPAVSTGSQEGVGPLPLDLAPRPNAHFFSPFGLFPPPLTTSALTHGTHSLPGLNPLYLPSIPGRGNTTCQICFKTFACQSALEIHIRSHTKERPFKCSICDRGFSTKGNMKQHMLTHKIRDGCRDAPMDPGFKHNGMSNPETSSASPLPSSLPSPIPSTHASPLPSSLPSPLPSSSASPLPPSLTSPIHPLLASPHPRCLMSPLPASLAGALPQSLASPLPSSLASPLPSSMASPLPPSSLASPLHSSLSSPLPASMSSPLPPSLPPAALAAVLLHQAREEDKLLDSRIKREREGENVLPVPKRASGLGGEGEGLEGDGSPVEGDQHLTPDPASCPSPAPEVAALPRT